MRITKLTLENFKGFSGSWSLAPVTMIAGQNFTHKTSLPLAIRLGLAGYLPPPLGTKKIYSLAGNPDQPGRMSISIEMDNGRKANWLWTKTAEGKVSVSKDHGSDIVMPELLLEPKLFFAKTGMEQIEVIFDACDIEDFDCKTLIAKLAGIQAMPIAISEIVLKEIETWFESNPLLGRASLWLHDLLDWLRGKVKSANEDQKIASGAFAAFKGDNAIAPAKDVSAELETAQSEFRKLNITPMLERERAQVLAKLAKYHKREDYLSEITRLKEFIPPDFDLDILDEELTDFASRIASKNAIIADIAGKLSMVKTQYDNLEKAEACPVCLSKKKGWKNDATETLRNGIANLSAMRDSTQASLAGFQKKLAKLQQTKEAAQSIAELESKCRELEDLQGWMAKLESESRVDPAALEQARLKVDELLAQQAAYTLWMKDRGRRENLEAKLVEAQCRLDVFKQAVAIVATSQEQLISTAFSQVLAVARHFTNGLLNSPIEFVEGQLGRRVSKADIAMGCTSPEGSWIPFDTFSGTEELLALAGFGVALTIDAPIHLVILDELGRLDAKRKMDVTLRMLSLAEKGVIDQAILVDVDPKTYQGINRPDFKLIAL